MELFFLAMVVGLGITIERIAGRAVIIRRDVSRLDRKLNLILEQMNITFDEFAVMSDRVKELARDSKYKAAAIKVYREETGSDFAEANEMVQAFIRSLKR